MVTKMADLVMLWVHDANNDQHSIYSIVITNKVLFGNTLVIYWEAFTNDMCNEYAITILSWIYHQNWNLHQSQWAYIKMIKLMMIYLVLYREFCSSLESRYPCKCVYWAAGTGAGNLISAKNVKTFNSSFIRIKTTAKSPVPWLLMRIHFE